MKDNRMQLFKEQVNIIKSFLSEHNIDMPFFIAGGSIFNIINNVKNEYNDIDVYCYNENDVEKIKNMNTNYDKYETANSLTFTKQHDGCGSQSCASLFNIDLNLSDYQRPIQFIIMKNGSVKDIFKTYDFNCSKIAFTSDNKLIHDDDFSKYIKFNENCISSDSLSRYRKYVYEKNAVDVDDLTIKKMFDYFIENKDIILKPKYSKAEPKSCLNLLNHFMKNPSNYAYIKHIHDKIVSYYDSQTRFDIFAELYQSLSNYSGEFCDELNVHCLLNNTKSFNNEEKENVISKYPEYFI